MQMKKILVFSNGEKIGDGIIKLPLLNEIKRRLPEYKIVWMTNSGETVYNNELNNINILLFINSLYSYIRIILYFNCAFSYPHQSKIFD